jgi:DNA-binding response OmpR family regulator
MTHILVVDDEPEMHWVLTELLRRDGCSITCVDSGPAALDALSRENVDLVLLDQRMPGIDGLETFARIRQMRIGVPVVFLSAYGEASTVVEAMQCGACDFLTKPLDNKTLLSKVRSLLSRAERSGTSPAVAEPAMGLTGESPQIVKVRQIAQKAATSGYSVLIQGETGVGKEVLAHAIYSVSPRAAGPFVARQGSVSVGRHRRPVSRRDQQPHLRPSGQVAEGSRDSPRVAGGCGQGRPGRRAGLRSEQRRSFRGQCGGTFPSRPLPPPLGDRHHDSAIGRAP